MEFELEFDEWYLIIIILSIIFISLYVMHHSQYSFHVQNPEYGSVSLRKHHQMNSYFLFFLHNHFNKMNSSMIREPVNNSNSPSIKKYLYEFYLKCNNVQSRGCVIFHRFMVCTVYRISFDFTSDISWDSWWAFI